MPARLLAALVPLALAAVGCQNALHDQNLALRQQNNELQDQLNGMRGELGRRPDSSQLGALQQGMSERDARIAELERQLQTQPAAAGGASQPGIDGLETEYSSATGELTVRIPGDVLFDAGVATLKPGAKGTLDKVAAAVQANYPDKSVRVEGHTDRDPLVKTKAQWGDNRNLSLQRALAVTRYLEGKGLSASKLVTSGFGEHAPRGEAKAKDRRVEVVVLTRD